MKARVSISKKAQDVLLEVQALTNGDSLSGAAETLISLSSEYVLGQLRAIKSSVNSAVAPLAGEIAQPVKQQTSEMLLQPVTRPRQLASEPMDF